MDFKQNNEKLEIMLDGHEAYSDLVDYQLYEENFATGFKFIFRRMLEDCNNKESDSRSDWMEQKDGSNILSFIGGRGAGKTTSMKEFCHILEDMNGKDSDDYRMWLKKVLEKEEDIDALKRRTVRFHILKMIDAGLLNESEDLMELILISLYQEHMEAMEANRLFSRGSQSSMLEMEALFEELLAMYGSSRRRNPGDEDYSLAALTRVTGNSALMREKISDLLTQMSRIHKNKADFDYYIVPIDDLDLNLEHGYEMIEQLQKYFSDKRIIILLTMDYEQLCDVCIEHFHRSMRFTDDLTGAIGLRRSQILATDMMTKVFPLDQRIFLPDARKQSRQMSIVMDRDSFKLIPVKKYIMEKVASCMRIYYDAKGEKRHFIEPDTVRQLVFYNDFLNSLNDIDFSNMKTWNQINSMKDEENKKQAIEFNEMQMAQYTHNHHRFNDDIAKRQAQVMLTVQHRQAFKTLLGFDISRRTMYFEKSRIDGNQIVFDDVSAEERRQYAYADLIRKIYIWGREHYGAKPFICCVLSAFTSEMVREYINYRYNPDAEKRAISESRLRKFMGRAFGNVWLGYSLCVEKTNSDIDDNVTQPRYYSSDSKDDINPEEADMDDSMLGFRNYASMKGAAITFSISLINRRKNQQYPTARSAGQGRRNMISEWLKQEKVVQVLECLDMFLLKKNVQERNEPAYEGADMSFDISYDLITDPDFDAGIFSDSDKRMNLQESVVQIKFTGDCMLDMFGFVPKSLNYSKTQNSVENKIINCLSEFLVVYLSGSPLQAGISDIKKDVERFVKRESVYSAVWKEPIKNEVAFPFYDLDLSYNVIKRFRGKIVGLESSENLCNYLVSIYGKLQELLKEEATEYSDVGFRYDRIFEKSVFIETLQSLAKEKKTNEKISSFLNYLSGWSVSLFIPSAADD